MVAEANAGSNGSAKESTDLVLVEDGQSRNGRPRRIFDLEYVHLLGSIGASRRDMAAALKCSVAVINSNLDDPAYEDTGFRNAYEQGRAAVCSKLRYRQIQLAMAGSEKMLTWLGMQLLGQKNVARQENKGGADAGGLPAGFTFTIKQGFDEEGRPTVEMKGERPAEQASMPARQFTVDAGSGDDDEP